MKAPTIAYTAILFISMALRCEAQDGVAYISLKSGERLSGVVLAVSDAKVIVQPDLEKYEHGYYTLRDYSVVCDGAFAVPFTDIDSLYLERSSAAWLIGFPGIPIVMTTAFLIALPTHGDGFGDGTFVAGAGLFIGTIIGAIVAPIIFFSTSSDFWVDMNDPSDINALKNSALYEDNLPPALQALE